MQGPTWVSSVRRLCGLFGSTVDSRCPLRTVGLCDIGFATYVRITCVRQQLTCSLLCIPGIWD